MKIGFLFNHDANHQIPHTIQIAAALAERGVDVEILTSSLEQRAVASAMLPATAAVRFTTLEVGSVSRVADRMLHHVAPFRRIAILRENLSAFARLDALVVPETTSTLLKTKFGLSSLKLIYVPHGAGDGAAGFQAATKNFDLVLLSGHKVRDRMLSLGLITQQGHAIVGYPKFDTVDLTARPRYFDNDKPTVLYNPHFNPLLSSWYTVGERVLDWFAAQDELNLIFAPHVMLFKRRLHTSIIHRSSRFRPNVPARFSGSSGISHRQGQPTLDRHELRAGGGYLSRRRIQSDLRVDSAAPARDLLQYPHAAMAASCRLSPLGTRRCHQGRRRHAICDSARPGRALASIAPANNSPMPRRSRARTSPQARGQPTRCSTICGPATARRRTTANADVATPAPRAWRESRCASAYARPKSG